MKYKKRRPSRPFIVPFMYYILGVAILVEMVWINIKVFHYEMVDGGIIGILAYIFAMLFIGGMGILSIIVGYKRRKW